MKNGQNIAYRMGYLAGLEDARQVLLAVLRGRGKGEGKTETRGERIEHQRRNRAGEANRTEGSQATSL